MAHRFSATVLIGLALGTTSGQSSLQAVQPGTLRTVHALHLPNASLGFAWARRYDTIAVVVKPVATGQPIRLVDARTLRQTRVIQVGDRDVCGLTFRGPTLFALAADRPCYWPGARFSVLRISPGGIARATPVGPALASVPIPNLAFGDGNAYVARVGGEIDAVDLHTGAVSVHRPQRVLAKGERLVRVSWLGAHRLGVGPNVVDVRTWRARRVVAGAHGLVGRPGVLVGWGPQGAEIVRGSKRQHMLADEPIGEAWIVGDYFYAAVGAATDVVDLRTGERVRVVLRSIELLG